MRRMSPLFRAHVKSVQLYNERIYGPLTINLSLIEVHIRPRSAPREAGQLLIIQALPGCVDAMITAAKQSGFTIQDYDIRGRTPVVRTLK